VGIRTPDQRVRVFVSSTLQELANERSAAREAITRLRLTPVLFELGARPHPPRELYRVPHRACASLFPAGGLLLDGSDRAAFDRRVAAARARLDEAAFAAGWVAGQAMTLERAIAVALEETRC
jgi:hypothetical protein